MSSRSADTLEFQSRVGRNEVRFVYSDWNGNDKVYFEEDSRMLAISFSKLSIKSID